jgi:hypothetical protein
MRWNPFTVDPRSTLTRNRLQDQRFADRLSLDRLEKELIAQVNSMVVVVCQLILAKMTYFALLLFNLAQLVAQSR